MSAFSKKIMVYLLLSAVVIVFTCRKLYNGQNNAEPGSNNTKLQTASEPNAFKNMLGVNAFEWNFLQNPANPNDGMQIYEPKMQLIQYFSGVRHYLDWVRIENEQGKYTFNPTHSGGWNLDVMYQRSQANGIDMLVCLKTCPNWLLQTYPEGERDAENVPMPYGADKSNPQSYVLQAKAGFQFAARYGSNAGVNHDLLSVDATPRWTADPINEVKVGLGLVKYIECDNERDKWWKGDKAHQTAEEYAANLSAFYDGHKVTLGNAVGVKNADPNMQIVMAGLAAPDVKYVEGMIEWCRKNRGYKADGTVNLCFDVINFHLYANDHREHSDDKATQGIAPELSEAAQTAADFAALGKKYNLPVWVTEAGYDVNGKSPQRAIPIGSKDALQTQADWTVRTALLYARYGIKKLFFYELYDDDINNSTQYASSGLIAADLKPRPAANYVAQVKKLLGDYSYKETISQDPLIDRYEQGNKTIYALVMPTQSGKTVQYTFKLPGTQQVVIHQLNSTSVSTTDKTESLNNGKLAITVTETPVFVELQ